MTFFFHSNWQSRTSLEWVPIWLQSQLNFLFIVIDNLELSVKGTNMTTKLVDAFFSLQLANRDFSVEGTNMTTTLASNFLDHSWLTSLWRVPIWLQNWLTTFSIVIGSVAVVVLSWGSLLEGVNLKSTRSQIICDLVEPVVVPKGSLRRVDEASLCLNSGAPPGGVPVDT